MKIQKKLRKFGVILGSLLVSVALNAQQSITNGLVNYWSFDNGSISYDSSGVTDSVSSENGTIIVPNNTTATIGSNGFVGEGIRLAADDNAEAAQRAYVNFDEPSAIHTNQSFTVSLWFNSSVNTAFFSLLSSGNVGSGNPGFSLLLDSNKVEIRAAAQGGTNPYRIGLTSPAVIEKNTWYNVVAVFDLENNIVIGYLNGIGSGSTGQLASGTALDNGWVTGAAGGQTNIIGDSLSVFSQAGKELYLGVDNDKKIATKAARSFDELAIWDRALSESEVLALYNFQLSGGSLTNIPEVSATGFLFGGLIFLQVFTRSRRKQ